MNTVKLVNAKSELDAFFKDLFDNWCSIRI